MSPKQMARIINYGALDVKVGKPLSWESRNRLKAGGIDPAPKNRFAQFVHNMELDRNQVQRTKGRPKKIKANDPPQIPPPEPMPSRRAI